MKCFDICKRLYYNLVILKKFLSKRSFYRSTFINRDLEY